MPRAMKEIVVLGLAGFAMLYLLMPSLIPDFIPLIGWIDEGVATTILLSALKYWGWDLTNLFNKGDDKAETKEETPTILLQNSEHRIRIPREVVERALAEYEREQQMGYHQE